MRDASVSPFYECTTHGVTVTVEPAFDADGSDPEDSNWLWTYHIVITNHADHPLTLRRRHWSIMDGLGRVREVDGPGVVGKEPRLGTGEQFSYVSRVPLSTPGGFMKGHFEMETQEGDRIEVMVPAFSLDSPHEPRALN